MRVMAWRVRPAVRPSFRTKSSPVCTQACPTEWRDKLLTVVVVVVARQTADRRARCITLLEFSGFAVRFSRSAIFFISEFLATIWPLIDILNLVFISEVAPLLALRR